MKNINYVINGVLAVAVIVLFILHFSGKSGKNDNSAINSDAGDDGVSVNASTLPIAYVNIDSLLINYNYAKDLYEIQMRKQENARLKLSQDVRTFENEMSEFQRKIDNNAFLTRERAEQEQQRLLKKRDDLTALDQRLSNELMEESQKMNESLRDTLISQLKIFNENKGFQVILSNTGGDNILLADDAYDITVELIDQMNKNYSTPKQ